MGYFNHSSDTAVLLNDKVKKDFLLTVQERALSSSSSFFNIENSDHCFLLGELNKERHIQDL